MYVIGSEKAYGGVTEYEYQEQLRKISELDYDDLYVYRKKDWETELDWLKNRSDDKLVNFFKYTSDFEEACKKIELYNQYKNNIEAINNFNELLDKVIKYIEDHRKDIEEPVGVNAFYVWFFINAYYVILKNDKNNWVKKLIERKGLTNEEFSYLETNIYCNIVRPILYNYFENDIDNWMRCNPYQGPICFAVGCRCDEKGNPIDKDGNIIKKEKTTKYTLLKKSNINASYDLFLDYDVELNEKYLNLLNQKLSHFPY